MTPGDIIEFRCGGCVLRGVLVYEAPDAGEDAATVRVRRVEDPLQAVDKAGWASREEHDRYWSLPLQVVAIPARALVRVTGRRRGTAWEPWTVDVWESVDTSPSYGYPQGLPVAVPPRDGAALVARMEGGRP